MPSFEDEKKGDIQATHAEHGEDEMHTSEKIQELSSIEDTAASKAAWLICITVSLGGFLFGAYRASSRSDQD